MESKRTSFKMIKQQILHAIPGPLNRLKSDTVPTNTLNDMLSNNAQHTHPFVYEDAHSTHPKSVDNVDLMNLSQYVSSISSCPSFLCAPADFIQPDVAILPSLRDVQIDLLFPEEEQYKSDQCVTPQPACQVRAERTCSIPFMTPSEIRLLFDEFRSGSDPLSL